MGMSSCVMEASSIEVCGESFDTPALPQPLTIESRRHKAGAPLGVAPKNRRPSSQPELVGSQYGSVRVISPDLIWLGQKERRFAHVLCECVGCGYRAVISLSNLQAGRTKGCRECNQPRKVPKWLYARAQQMQRRCTKPKASGFENYGGRGIRFNFDSPMVCALWIVQHLGVPEGARDMELDRMDNNGHYEPGNIRWATKIQNSSNRRVSRWAPMAHKFKLAHPEVRYADVTLSGLIASGLSFEEILARWHAPSKKPKGKYGTCSTADPAIASLAKAS